MGSPDSSQLISSLLAFHPLSKIPLRLHMSSSSCLTQCTWSGRETNREKVTLNCTYDLSGVIYPFWYIQDPGQPPRLFLRDFGKDDSDEGNLRDFSAAHKKTPKTFNLEKAASQLNDSVKLADAAVYYCALSDTVCQGGTIPEELRQAGGGMGDKSTENMQEKQVWGF
uniref:Immunoglobulin V-set domain-containing protein n=1 Tax=Podarcis muralis TaxID=64176 RepID=A0A670JBQ0_PODMU